MPKMRLVKLSKVASSDTERKILSEKKLSENILIKKRTLCLPLENEVYIFFFKIKFKLPESTWKMVGLGLFPNKNHQVCLKKGQSVLWNFGN